MRPTTSRRALFGIPLLAALLVLLLPGPASAITNGEPDGDAIPTSASFSMSTPSARARCSRPPSF